MGKINFLLILTLKKIKMYTFFAFAGLITLLIYILLFKMGQKVRASVIVLFLFALIAIIMDHSGLGMFRSRVRRSWRYIKQLVTGGLVDKSSIVSYLVRMQHQMYKDYHHIGPYYPDQVVSSMVRLNINDDNLKMYGIAAFTKYSNDDPASWYDVSYGMARKELADLLFNGNLDFGAHEVSHFVNKAGGFDSNWGYGGFDHPFGGSNDTGSSGDGR